LSFVGIVPVSRSPFVEVRIRKFPVSFLAVPDGLFRLVIFKEVLREALREEDPSRIQLQGRDW
jgi:hypothetical protein